MQPEDPAQHLKHFPTRRLRLAAILEWTALSISTAIWECGDNKAFMAANAIT